MHWKEVVSYCKENGNKKTYKKFKHFFINETNPRRKLRKLIFRADLNITEVIASNEPPYGVLIDGLLKIKVEQHMKQNNHNITAETARSYLVELLKTANMTNILVEYGGKFTFERRWMVRALRRWNIALKTKFVAKKSAHNKSNLEENKQRKEVTMSNEQYVNMVTDTSSIIRRKAYDDLPCKAIRVASKSKAIRIRYEDEDEEDCWFNTLNGDQAAVNSLTLEDRLLLPCSVRSKFHNILLPFDIIYNQRHF